jgi:UDP-N-acetylmuramoyl-tripeptide--D-alanyl-D-alanine ligase
MKQLIQYILKILSKAVLWRYGPEVIGITGSIGKTSAKDAIYAVLKSKFLARKNIKNYNNEIGLPLTIIGENSGGSSAKEWIKIIFRSMRLLVRREADYPKMLILEMGVDRPGDMAYLNKIVQARIGVITYIGQSHIEFFGSEDGIRKEKELLIKNLPSDGWAIINYDNEGARQIGDNSKVKNLAYGLSEKSAVRAMEVALSYDEDNMRLRGTSFKLGYDGSFVPVLLPDVLGLPAVYAALAGAAAGIIYGMNLVEISQALKYYIQPKGRLNLINGINDSLIIDDTYNSSPPSTILALETAGQIKRGKFRWAVLGDMLELGGISKSAHRKIGEYILDNNFNRLVTVGSDAVEIGDTARKLGMKAENIFHFLDSISAGRFLKSAIAENDLLLIKGSQGMRMERIVKEIMAEPEKARDLLVRQDKEWNNK